MANQTQQNPILGAGAETQTAMALVQIANNGNLMTQVLSRLIQTLTGILPFSGATGTFTCAAAASTTITQTSVSATSVILLMPTNAAAATLISSAKSLYISTRTAGVSFAVATADATAAAGTETFGYTVINLT